MGYRESVVNTAIRYNGMSFGGRSHKGLIDEFNKHKPDGAPMTYVANFCAACASAVAYKCGCGDAYPCSYNVGTIVAKAKRMGIWVENDAYVPSPGDWIVYAWNDSGSGDNTTGASHVGIVVGVGGGYINVFEFNIGNQRKTGYRKVAVNGRFIRGFVHPNFQTPGWQKGAHGWWYKLPSGGYHQDCWAKIDGEWFYFDRDGYCLIDRWAQISGNWYHFNEQGHMQTGWISAGAWFYCDSSGKMLTGWQEIDGKTYYFDADGYMRTGWLQKDDGKWVYLQGNGSRLDNNVREINGGVYAFDSNGEMLTGDIKLTADESGKLVPKKL